MFVSVLLFLCAVTKAERTALLTRFNKIDSGKQGYLSKRQLLTSLSPTMACFPLVENIVDVIIRRRMRNDGTAMVASKKARKLAQNSVFPADFLVFASMFSPKQKQARKLVGSCAARARCVRECGRFYGCVGLYVWVCTFACECVCVGGWGCGPVCGPCGPVCLRVCVCALARVCVCVCVCVCV